MEKTDKKENLSCAGCLNDIADNDYVSALRQDWHKDCFRCSVCDSLLSSWYFEKSGLLFCQNDYWARYGESCQQCAQVITGPVMAAGDHRFHPECFACVACGAHIEDTEPYVLLERSKLYCGGCYSDGALTTSAAHATSGSHAIRAVHVPARAFRAAYSDTQDLRVIQGRCGDKLSRVARALLRAVISLCIQLTCHRIDSSCGVLALHIGDRILEINGAPVRSRQLEDIDKVLPGPDTVIQLTIEHNPETVNNNKQKNIPMCNPQTDIDRENDHRHTFPTHDNNVSKTIPDMHSNVNVPDQRQEKSEIEIEEGLGRKERLFKRKVDGSGKPRVIKRRQTPSSPLLGDKERSSSMSKLLDAVDGGCSESTGVLCDLSRARSFRVPDPGSPQKVFRASDLLQGELLGSGFFGQVYKVTHRDTNEVMVLKQLYRLDEEAQNNFLKEVAVLRSLQHPNVLRFVGVLYKDKRLHLVTEYVAGGTLHQLLQDGAVELSWAERARLARDVAAGVGYLHRMNVIHRDLNSHNCLVREDKTVIVADFGLARIVQRTASSTLERQRSHSTLRRKRYTVVGNPYWMAPEMMNGNVYDEKVDVFSFGIIICEIIGRVSADPDFLPRRMDFGLNEPEFLKQFCRGAPEAFYRIAFLACDLEPDHRPKFEVIEIWLESLVMHLSKDRAIPADLLADILQYARGVTEIGHATPECCQLHVNSIFCTGVEECCQRRKCGSCEKLRRSPSKVASQEITLPEGGVIKSKSNATMLDHGDEDNSQPPGMALGKCVSASHIWQAARPTVTVPSLSRSHHTLTGYILRADPLGKNINITKVDDITKWLDPPQQLKRVSPDSQLNNLVQDPPTINKTRRVEDKPNVEYEGNLPAFMRNQSVEGLETEYKNEIDAPLPFCRHFSIPDNCEIQDDSDSSDEDLTSSNWYRNVSAVKMDVDQPKNILAGIVKKGENIFGKKSSYDITDITLRNPEYLKGERKINEVDSRRFNIDYLTRNPLMATGVKNIPKLIEPPKVEKSAEKTNFFTKKLLSPKLSRLFKPNTAEIVRNKPETCDNTEEKSRSKFFIQSSVPPTSRSSYRVRPVGEDRKAMTLTDRKLSENNVIKSDIKLASMGKPMTPIFRRHIPTERPEFADGRFSYRDRRPKYDLKSNQEAKFVEIGRNRIKAPLEVVEKKVKLAPLIRSSQSNNIPALTTVLEKKTNKLDLNTSVPKSDEKGVDVHKRREPGISRSNYVSLANLKINSKVKDLEQVTKDKPVDTDDSSPVERVI